ncbi:transporter substrate-binding domain-containing protein [Azospirillum sp.]|uniref:substrate-binding periplasmic protein n=1 Tax=Azospirillum sp. TaxID=34012 RepID=UPI002D5ADF75|nr:transporter substrate-binding domain-containing protein [Azospirillum sp.]HYD66328.1 transporter substrate-binding domain-containing protein [Azospirillum sp.]
MSQSLWSKAPWCGLIAALALWLSAVMPAMAGDHVAKTLYLNTGVGAPYTTPDHKGFLDQLVSALFARLGLEAQVMMYEATERGIINANKGIEDGLVLRVRGLEKAYPNLVMVPEKLIDNDFVAISINHDFPVDGWASLAPYEIAYIIGWKIFEANLPQARQVTPVADAGQLFTMLEKDRTQVVLYERWQGQWRLRELGARGRILEPPLARTEMFIYLHKDRQALVGPAAAELARMKADGTYRAIFERTLGPYPQ